MHPPLISVIIPSFNEERTVGTVIENTISVVESLGNPYEIILVDDGSTDRTKEMAQKYKTTLLTNGGNMGKGTALRKGFKQASGDIIVTIDSDGEHDPKDIPDLIYPLYNGSDITTGSRYLGDGKDSTYRLNRIGNFIFNRTIRLMTGENITDSQTGFRALKKEALEKLDLESTGYEIEAEITMKGLMKGLVFQEIPINYQKRKYNISKIRTVRDGIKIFSTILKARFTN